VGAREIGTADVENPEYVEIVDGVEPEVMHRWGKQQRCYVE